MQNIQTDELWPISVSQGPVCVLCQVRSCVVTHHAVSCLLHHHTGLFPLPSLILCSQTLQECNSPLQIPSWRFSPVSATPAMGDLSAVCCMDQIGRERKVLTLWDVTTSLLANWEKLQRCIWNSSFLIGYAQCFHPSWLWKEFYFSHWKQMYKEMGRESWESSWTDPKACA